MFLHDLNEYLVIDKREEYLITFRILEKFRRRLIHARHTVEENHRAVLFNGNAICRLMIRLRCMLLQRFRSPIFLYRG